MDVLTSLKFRVSIFTQVRIFTMTKKLWHRHGHSPYYQRGFHNEIVFTTPLCLLYASHIIRKYSHCEHILPSVIRYQHIGLYNILKERHILHIDEGDWWRYYLTNIFVGGHYGLCKKSFDKICDDYMALGSAISAGHMDLLKLYLANVSCKEGDLIALFGSLLLWISPDCDWYYETAEILLSFDSTIADHSYIHDPKLLALIR